MKFLLSITLSLALVAFSFGQAGEDLPTFPARALQCGTVPVAGTNEIQTLTLGGTPTGGSFTITFAGRTSGAITWTATDATLVSNIDTALEAMPNIGTGGVTTAAGTVTAGIGTITITFTGNNAKLDVALATTTSSLTGTAPTVVIATTTAGVTADGRKATKGTLLIDVTNGILYINTSGTSLNPTWTKVGTQT